MHILKKSASYSVGFQMLFKHSVLKIKNNFRIKDSSSFSSVLFSREQTEEQLGSFCWDRGACSQCFGTHLVLLVKPFPVWMVPGYGSSITSGSWRYGFLLYFILCFERRCSPCGLAFLCSGRKTSDASVRRIRGEKPNWELDDVWVKILSSALVGSN